MKRLLDRLLERQRKLMSDLAEDAPAAAKSKPRATALPPLPGEEADLAQALVALDQGDLRKAQAILQPYRERAGLARTALTLARMSLVAGDFEQAEQLLKRAEALDSTDPKAWWVFADLYRRTHRFAEEVLYRRRLAYADKSPSPLHDLELLRALYAASPKGNRPLATEIELTADRILALPELAPETRAEVAEVMLAVPKLAPRARAEMAAAWPPGRNEHDVSAAWTRLAKWCMQHKRPFQRQDDAGKEGHRPTLATLEDAWTHPGLQWAPVLGEGAWMVADTINTNKLVRRHASGSSPLLMVGRQGAVLRMRTDARRIAEPAMLVGGIGNYEKDLVDYVGSVATAERIAGLRDLRMVVARKASPHVPELLRLLGYRNLVEVDSDEWVRFDTLEVPSRPSWGSTWVDPYLPQWYRTRLLDGTPGANRDILVRPARTDGLVMNDGVTRLAQQHDLEVVEPERLDVAAAIRRFAAAECVVSPIHESLANIVFMKPGARVVLLAPRQILRSGGAIPFEALARACKHDFRVVEGAPMHSESATSAERGYAIDESQLLAAL